MVGSGLFCLTGLVTLSEDGDGHVLTEPVGQGDCSTELLLSMADVKSGAYVQLYGFIKLWFAQALDECDGFGG